VVIPKAENTSINDTHSLAAPAVQIIIRQRFTVSDDTIADFSIAVDKHVLAVRPAASTEEEA
jgi:hypothetical protein